MTVRSSCCRARQRRRSSTTTPRSPRNSSRRSRRISRRRRSVVACPCCRPPSVPRGTGVVVICLMALEMFTTLQFLRRSCCAAAVLPFVSWVTQTSVFHDACHFRREPAPATLGQRPPIALRPELLATLRLVPGKTQRITGYTVLYNLDLQLCVTFSFHDTARCPKNATCRKASQLVNCNHSSLRTGFEIAT